MGENAPKSFCENTSKTILGCLSFFLLMLGDNFARNIFGRIPCSKRRWGVQRKGTKRWKLTNFKPAHNEKDENLIRHKRSIWLRFQLKLLWTWRMKLLSPEMWREASMPRLSDSLTGLSMWTAPNSIQWSVSFIYAANSKQLMVSFFYFHPKFHTINGQFPLFTPQIPYNHGQFVLFLSPQIPYNQWSVSFIHRANSLQSVFSLFCF